MRILKQPNDMDFTQPLLNKVLRVHVALMYEHTQTSDSMSRTFYDAKTREVLPWSNWRVKFIRRFGS